MLYKDSPAHLAQPHPLLHCRGPELGVGRLHPPHTQSFGAFHEVGDHNAHNSTPETPQTVLPSTHLTLSQWAAHLQETIPSEGSGLEGGRGWEIVGVPPHWEQVHLGNLPGQSSPSCASSIFQPAPASQELAQGCATLCPAPVSSRVLATVLDGNWDLGRRFSWG